MNGQAAIFLPKPPAARYLSFSLFPDTTTDASKAAVQLLGPDDGCVVGIDESLVSHWGGGIDGLRGFPPLTSPAAEIPSTQQALWCWLRGDDRGELLHRGRAIAQDLGPAFRLDEVVDGFKFGDGELGRDLSGYEDGTENPVGDDAVEAALVSGRGPGLDGSSFVAVQRWVHDLDALASLPQQEQDHIIGRRRSDNEEIESAPESAHVKRTAQEDFNPEAFVVRRSMSWANGTGEGLIFVAFAHTLDAFEAQLNRMTGLEDGIIDGLFRFSHPVTGGYYWCPPVRGGKLDLSALQD